MRTKPSSSRRRPPTLPSEALSVGFQPGLRVRGGHIVKRGGAEVHAATFLRKREIVLDAALLGDPPGLARIFLHELFHFVWLRLGNAERRSYEELLKAELRRRAPGELGWSAETRKRALAAHDRKRRTRRWREYVCESFCDTAAWCFARGRHEEFTLGARFRPARRNWFRNFLARAAISI